MNTIGELRPRGTSESGHYSNQLMCFSPFSQFSVIGGDMGTQDLGVE